MSAWPGKYVIGLTGNIATGKSVVRKMLEHLGVYGIDADALGHRAIAPGSPGYKPVVEMFGKWILSPDGQIDRSKLGSVAFAHPEAMQRLEEIIHPLVGQALDILIRRSRQSTVVVEAIKLLESGLAKKCDIVWVTYAPQELQLARLMQKRGLDEASAHQMISSQPLQERKTAGANVVIRNDGSYEDTWEQVMDSYYQTFPGLEGESVEKVVEAVAGELTVQRARPQEADEVATLINHLSEGRRKVTHDDIMAAFGEKAFMLLRIDGKPLGVVGWKVENLVARTDDVYIDKNLNFLDSLRVLMDEVERASQELQCEVSLLFLPVDMINKGMTFKTLGYQRRTIQGLGVSAWEEAAQESMTPGSVLLFKQLRQDRVLRPV
jgi:dephospho-CoA kinase